MKRADEVVVLVPPVAKCPGRPRAPRRRPVRSPSHPASTSGVRRRRRAHGRCGRGRAPSPPRAWSSTARASPSARSTRRRSTGSPRRNAPRATARSANSSRSSGCSASKRHSVERLSSGAFSAKNGFSVVAPMRTTRPSSTPGSSASCCDWLKRWISSRNRIVPRPSAPSAASGVVEHLADVAARRPRRAESGTKSPRRVLGERGARPSSCRCRADRRRSPRRAGPPRPAREAARPAPRRWR